MAGTSLSAPHPTIANLYPVITDSLNSNHILLAYCTGTPDTTAGTYAHGALMIQRDSGTGANAVYQNTGSSAVPAWTLFDTGTGFALPTTATDSSTTTGTSFGITANSVTTGTVEKIIANGLTTGEALLITHTTAVIADGGSLMRATSTSVDTGGATQGVMLDLTSSGSLAGTMVLMTNSALTTGIGMSMVNAAQTSGAALSITTALATTGGGIVVTTPSSNAIVAGLAGATNPAFQVDASTASSVTGLKVKSGATGTGVALSTVSSATDDSLKADAKGAGVINIGSTSTGLVTLSRGAVKSIIVGSTTTTFATQSITPSAAQTLGGIISHASTTGAGTYTFDNGTNFSSAVTGVATGDTFLSYYANTGTQTVTLTSATGATIQGTAAVAAGKNATLLFRNTGTNTWTVYSTVSA